LCKKWRITLQGKHSEAEIIGALKQTMPNIISAIKHQWNTRIVSARKRMWDKLYASGFGYQLSLPGEQEHNQALVDFMVSANKNTTILDVGCGEGLLLDYLGRWGYQKYLGIKRRALARKPALHLGVEREQPRTYTLRRRVGHPDCVGRCG
jgi:2-polyprenyl-3-methyl-5-hydroxy-6-metoxy-1,4-benzoquinol methylase